MHQAYALSESRFDFAGCVALTGSDAGKVSINPSSSSNWVLRSAFRASFGSAAYLSCAAGSNFLADFPAMNPSICGDNARLLRAVPFPFSEGYGTPVGQSRGGVYQDCRKTRARKTSDKAL